MANDSTNTAISADTSQSTLRYIRELSGWGINPTAGDMKELRFTGESLNVVRSTAVSDEIRSDRQVTDLIRTKIEASGDINGELSYQVYDDFIAAALGKEWGASINVTTIAPADVTITAGVLKIPPSDFPDFILGQAVKFGGFAEGSVNNRIATITKFDATAGTVDTLPALADEPPTGNLTIQGSAVQNGSEIHSFLIEKEFLDVSKLIAYSGMAVNQMSMSVEAEGKVTNTFSFLGRHGETPDSTLNPGAIIPAPSHAIMSSGVQDSTIFEGTQEIGLIKMLTIQAANNLRGKTALGTVGNIDVGTGRFNLTGTISAYFENFRLYKSFLEHNGTSIIFTLRDEDSGTYVFNMPLVKFTESSIMAGGPDQDVMVTASYQALRDPDSGSTLIISRIDE